MQNKIAYQAALELLQASAEEFKIMFEHGTLSLELYKPDTVDKQSPHDRDEVYLVASGHGKFMLGNEVTDIKAGDFLFVPAGAVHRFLEFTSDFSTWILFYGLKGGEQGIAKNYLRQV